MNSVFHLLQLLYAVFHWYSEFIGRERFVLTATYIIISRIKSLVSKNSQNTYNTRIIDKEDLKTLTQWTCYRCVMSAKREVDHSVKNQTPRHISTRVQTT
jgi:hypothetical protein